MEKRITFPGIIKFWTPLALMWIVMALEMPVINSFVARMPHPKENLAVFGVVFSLALIIEGPIIQMLSAATAVATHYNNYKKLLNFMHTAAVILTTVHLICAIPPVFSFIASNLLNIDSYLIPAAQKAFLFMFLWTPSIGYRRMWQGVLIQDGRTVSVTLSMLMRMTLTCCVAMTGYYSGLIPGSLIAAISLSIGVFGGAVFAALFARKTVVSMKATDKEYKTISYKKLLLFYFPLAMTSFITMANRPILTAGIGWAEEPLESLAIWPVIISFMFLFQGFPLSFQETAISLMKNRENIPKLRNFVIYLSFFTLVFYSAVIFSPLKNIILKNVMGLKDELIDMAMIPLFILMVLTVVTGLIAWLRAVNIKTGRTINLATAVFVNFTALLISVFLLNHFFDLNGAVLAAIAYTVSVCAEAFFLIIKTGKVNCEEQEA